MPWASLCFIVADLRRFPSRQGEVKRLYTQGNMKKFFAFMFLALALFAALLPTGSAFAQLTTSAADTVAGRVDALNAIFSSVTGKTG